MIPSVKQLSIHDVISSAPSVSELTAASLNSAKELTLVCAAGFEFRHDAIAKATLEAGCRLKKVVILTLDSNTDADTHNATSLSDSLRPVTDHDPMFVNGDSSSFIRDLQRAIASGTAENATVPNVLYDISVSANRLILRTLYALIKCDLNLTIGYAEAGSYFPTQSEFETSTSERGSLEKDSTEEGVLEIRTSTEFAGEHLDALPNTLILLPSFHHERSAAVTTHVDPALAMRSTDDVIWILGRPHYSKDLWRCNAMRTLNHIGADACTRECGTFDYRECWGLLEQLYQEKWETSNLTISPLGSKMQAVRVAMFCMRHPDVRVLLSVPQSYNTYKWSDGVHSLWQIQLGETRTLKRQLANAGMLIGYGFEE